MDSGLQSTAQLFSQDGSGGCTPTNCVIGTLRSYFVMQLGQESKNCISHIPVITVAFKVQVEIEIPEYQAPSVALE